MMKQLVKQFMVWVMLVTILVATSGFRLVTHACHSCGVAELTLSDPDPCCLPEPNHTEPAHSECCSVSLKHLDCTGLLKPETCCIIESVLLKVDTLINANAPKIAPEIIDLSPASFWSNQMVEFPHSQLAFVNNHLPPVIFSGTEYLVYIQQFKIPAC